MFRFLLTRRWILFAIFVVVLGAACWRLGVWQFDRLEERRVENTVVERNLDRAAASALQVLPAHHPLPAEALWRRVRLTGTYDLSAQTLVRYQTRDGRPGVQVLTPLVTPRGVTVLVDRGWMAVTNDPNAPVRPPPPAAGRVTVTGWALPDQDGETDQITPLDGEVRLISSRGFTDVVSGPLRHGYVAADTEAPRPRHRLVTAEPPTLDSGPHFFYGLQWWFFAALALGGFGYFAYLESRDRRGTG